MKLTDFLQDVGRPVAYYPSMRKITGSTNATILLCQLIYWCGKQRDPNGWIYKSVDEVEEETGLTYEEQRGARKKLISNGLIEEKYARLSHRLEFRVLEDSIDEAWENAKTNFPQMGNSQMVKTEIPISYTESTAEITSQITPASNSDSSVESLHVKLNQLTRLRRDIDTSIKKEKTSFLPSVFVESCSGEFPDWVGEFEFRGYPNKRKLHDLLMDHSELQVRSVFNYYLSKHTEAVPHWTAVLNAAEKFFKKSGVYDYNIEKLLSKRLLDLAPNDAQHDLSDSIFAFLGDRAQLFPAD